MSPATLHPSFYHPWDRLQCSLGGAILKDLKSKFTLLRELREKEGGTISCSFSFLSPISPPLSCCYHCLLFAAFPSLPSPPSCNLYLHFQFPSLSDYVSSLLLPPEEVAWWHAVLDKSLIANLMSLKSSYLFLWQSRHWTKQVLNQWNNIPCHHEIMYWSFIGLLIWQDLE